MSVIITLPNKIEKQLQDKWGNDLPRKAVEALAVEGYRLGVLSIGQISEMLSLSLNETDGFLKVRGVFAIESIEEIDTDQSVLEKILAEK